MTHEDYMREALELARACVPDGDIPVDHNGGQLGCRSGKARL